jgi:hypothetical protein
MNLLRKDHVTLSMAFALRMHGSQLYGFESINESSLETFQLTSSSYQQTCSFFHFYFDFITVCINISRSKSANRIAGSIFSALTLCERFVLRCKTLDSDCSAVGYIYVSKHELALMRARARIITWVRRNTSAYACLRACLRLRIGTRPHMFIRSFERVACTDISRQQEEKDNVHRRQ